MYRILVKRHRRRRRMSQKMLAIKSGSSASYLSHIEADNSIRNRTPTLQVIEAIALSLKICVNDLVFYPCIECSLNIECKKKDKDMRSPDEIINELLDFYV